MWLSSAQFKRHRALQEPVTSENIEQCVERNRTIDLCDLLLRQKEIPDEGTLHQRSKQNLHVLTSVSVYIKHTSLLKQLKARDPDASSGSSRVDIRKEDDSQYTELVEDNEKFLRIVNADQAQNFDGTSEIDSVHLIESIEELGQVENLEEPGMS